MATRNPGFAGLRRGIRATLVSPRRRRARARRAGRRLPPRNKFGHFMKRRAAVKARRARPAPRRRYRRAARGRFTSHYSPKYVRRQRRRPTKTRKHYRARVLIRPRQRIAGLVVRNPHTGEFMPMATVVNPRRKRRRSRRNGLVAVNRRRRRSSRSRRRRNPGLVAVNRRRRRVRRNPRRRSYRRNPGMGSLMGAFKSSLPMAMGGVAGGVAAGFIDTKVFVGRPTLSILAKLGAAVVGGMLLRRRFPGLANGIVGGMMGSVGYSVGVKLGGGMVAHNAAGAIKGLGDMAGEDQALTNLLSGTGFGVLLEGLGDGSVQSYLSGDDGMLASNDGSDDGAAGLNALGLLLQ